MVKQSFLYRNAGKIALVGCAITLSATFYLWRPLDLPFREHLVLQQSAESALDTVQRISEMLITLSTTLIAGALFFFVRHLDRPVLGHPLDRALLVLATGFAGASLYCGYLSYHALLGMIAENTIDVQGMGLAKTLKAQFYCFIGGVASLVALVVLHLDRSEDVKNV
jgi:hypothetical protein